MSSVQIRAEINKLLPIADERPLAAVFSMLKSYLEHDPTLVGFTADGDPLTKADLVRLVEASRNEATAENVVTSEQLLGANIF